MNHLIRQVERLYGLLLRLYPRPFREAFGEEMTDVFAQAMREAAGRGARAWAAVGLREGRDLPLSVGREHWRSLADREAIMTAIHRKPEWFFYPAWVIIQTLAIPMAFIVSFAILMVAKELLGGYITVGGVRHITEDFLLRYTFFPANSLLTGLLQYALLRRYLPQMGAWVLATAGGWVLGAFLIFGWTRVAPVIWPAAGFGQFWAVDPAYFVLGLSVGVGQWLLLRRRLPRAGWWIAANVAGWVLLRLFTGETLDDYDLYAIGMLPACVTAVMLGLLMKGVGPADPQSATA